MADLSHIAEQLRPLAVPVHSLVIDPANARKHSSKNIDAIAASLRVYGQRKPVIVNKRNGVIEAGNGTVEAALKLGWLQVAVVYVDDDPITAAGFSVVDNRVAELAEWDQDSLAKIIQELDTGDDDINTLISELASASGVVPPDFNALENESIRLDEKTPTQCPKCGHEFVP